MQVQPAYPKRTQNLQALGRAGATVNHEPGVPNPPRAKPAVPYGHGAWITSVPAVESSQALSPDDAGNDGALQGMLARDHNWQYLPAMAGPPGSINFDLVNISSRRAPRTRYTWAVPPSFWVASPAFSH